MVEKRYDWENGAKLEDHSRKKHSVLAEYVRQYLITRCQLPRQERFRLGIVDGFAGGGIYGCGSFGSPIIFVDTLIATSKEINLNRISQGLKPIQIECLLILNDATPSVTEQLKQNLSPHLARAKIDAPNLVIVTEYHSEKFEVLYPKVKARINSARLSNVFFNLDQCGYSMVSSTLIRDIMSSWNKAEVFLTFMIESILTYLSPKKESSRVPLEQELQNSINHILEDVGLLSKQEWLGEAEKIVHAYLKKCAQFVSPFSINNPGGWRYWLMHFANFYRAREVYNNTLHEDDQTQAHFGRTGLNMLSYDPNDDGTQLYLFDNNSRNAAKAALHDDIPRLVAAVGDTISMDDFYAAAYSETPAHSDDIHEMIIQNPDLEVRTESGGRRQQANTIKVGDTLKLTNQKSFIFSYKN